MKLVHYRGIWFGTLATAMLMGVAARAARIVFFDGSQTTNLVESGTTWDTIGSEGYLFTVTRDKLFTGGGSLTNGRPLRVFWPDGLEAQAVTAGPVQNKARIDVARQDGEPFAIETFTAQLLGNTYGAGAAIEVMPMLNGEDARPDPYAYNATGFYGQHFTYTTPELRGFDAYKITLYVDYALMRLTVLDTIPELSIARVDDAVMEISWSTNSVGYTLQYATNLPAQTWTAATNIVATVGNRFIVEVENIEPKRFYRLRK